MLPELDRNAARQALITAQSQAAVLIYEVAAQINGIQERLERLTGDDGLDLAELAQHQVFALTSTLMTLTRLDPLAESLGWSASNPAAVELISRMTETAVLLLDCDERLPDSTEVGEIRRLVLSPVQAQELLSGCAEWLDENLPPAGSDADLWLLRRLSDVLTGMRSSACSRFG